MTPLERVLAKLPDARPNGQGWIAPCPVHEADGRRHRPSLSIAQGEDGRALLHCHAGCSPESICKALGLELRDLFADDGQATTHRKAGSPKAPAAHKPAPRTAATAHRFDLPCLAAKSIARQVGGDLAGWWPYAGTDGAAVLTVLRFNLPDGGKTYRPIHPVPGGWTLGDPPGPLPLYGIADLDGAPRVYVPEGEKCVDATAGIGLVACTSAHGAGSASKSDWRPLAGRNVVILPDNDDNGRRYAEDVARILTGLTPPATVRIVRLPGLPKGGDIVDYLEIMDGHTNEEVAAGIAALADAAPVYCPAQTPADDLPAAASTPVLICMADVEPEPLRWLWHNRIPLGKVTLIFGDPGLGKSLVTLNIAARVSRGMAWPDAPGAQMDAGGVILLSAEDDVADTIRPRLDAAGADTRRVTVLQGVRYGDSQAQGYFNLACDLPALETAIRRTPDARLVVIDPISAYLGGTDSHKNADIRGLLAPLADLAARHDVAVLTVTHLNKGAGGRALYRATGSLAFIAAARAGWLVISDADNPCRRLFLPAKANLAVEPTGLAYALESIDVPGIGSVGRVRWEPEPVTLTADEALAAAAADPEDRTDRALALDWLNEALANGPMRATDLATAAKENGISWPTLRRAKKDVGIRAERRGFGKEGTWFWCLPGPIRAASQGGPTAIDAQHIGLSAYGENAEQEGAE